MKYEKKNLKSEKKKKNSEKKLLREKTEWRFWVKMKLEFFLFEVT
jgi:hypothetical protein